MEVSEIAHVPGAFHRNSGSAGGMLTRVGEEAPVACLCLCEANLDPVGRVAPV